MKAADPMPLFRALDLLRIALDLPTGAERRAIAAREVARVTMHASRSGVAVHLPNGRKLFVQAKAFSEK